MLLSCSSDGGGSAASSPSRADALTQITDEVILPGLQASVDTTATLHTAVKDLCATPSDTTLDAARGAWGKAQGAWMATAAYRIGPIGELRSKAKIGYPISTEKLEKHLAKDASEVGLGNIDELGADLRGLGAIEYILFTPQSLSSLAPQRCAFAEAAAASVNNGATELSQAWTDGYAREFKSSGQSGIDDLVNGSLAALASVGDMALGPEAKNSGAAHRALADAAEELGSVRAVWGDAPGGIDGLVAAKSVEAAKSFTNSLDSAIASLDDPEGAFEHVKAARIALRTEVASQLGVTVSFTDSDGDG
ncbi:MAG TPA: imelysin family protein [Microthrixaceae bacterium]|nr:imelysin family protein [Microthrixaceae bacterium]